MAFNVIEGCTYFNSFIFQGKEYPLNTVVQLKDSSIVVHRKYINQYPRIQIVEYFTNRNGDACWTYALWTGNKYGAILPYYTTRSPDELVYNIVGYPELQEKEVCYHADSEVTEVKFGWVIYIVLMIALMVFRDFVVGWVFVSIYFFLWRKNKLQIHLL